MFIGGLNWETTDRKPVTVATVMTKTDDSTESLRDYFSQFGEVTECTVMRDGATGRSRGFGFLTFRDYKTVNTVMVKEHYLDGKIVGQKDNLTSSYCTNSPFRLTPSAPFHATNRRRLPRSLLEVSVKTRQNSNSKLTLLNSVE